MMMETHRLRQVLVELSGTLVSLQRQIEEANELLETVSTARSGTGDERLSTSGLSSRNLELERRLEELATDRRELRESLEQIIARHGMCEAEINHAVMAREAMMKKYRLLVRVAADLLQRVMEEFPEEEYDQDLQDAVDADLERVRRRQSPGSSSTSSSRTARPTAKGVFHHSRASVRSSEALGPQAGPSNLAADMSYTSSSDSHISTLAEGPAVSDGAQRWIHTGSKCPGSINVLAGPFLQRDLLRLGIEEAMLDDIIHSLIDPTDVGIRVARSPSPPQGLPNVELVFLYDPFYLESGAKTYILDWTTPSTSETIIDWLERNNREEDNPVFHTFTFSKKKGHWYYFGGVRLTSDPQQIWPTLDEPGYRAKILHHLSERSHGTITPEEVERQMEAGQLQELSIEIAPVDERNIMGEISRRLGKSPRIMKHERPFVVRGEQ